MVENFTKKEDETYESAVKEITKEVEDTFQVKIQESIQSLAKEPSQQCIDNILNYSKSIRKK